MTTLSNKTPVTVLTGFLGAGKTNLLNRILRDNPGERIVVIENELGAVSVNQNLGSGERSTRLVFIGRDLSARELMAGFKRRAA